MYVELKMELEGEELNYKQSSNLQGVIMENIDERYAEKLHHCNLNPYSQCLLKEDGKTIWKICTVNEEAYEQMIIPLSKLADFTIKNKKNTIYITKKEIRIKETAELLKEFYEISGKKFIDIMFQTPTAFKQNGKYIFYPELHLLYQSLMNKYSASSEIMEMMDEETLLQLEENSEIIRYRLQSIPFPMEGINVPGFVGTIRIRFRGTNTMMRYIRLLLRFGEYSGVGIKTAMGMGAIKIISCE